MGATSSKSNSLNLSFEDPKTKRKYNINVPNNFNAFIRNVFENYEVIPTLKQKNTNKEAYLNMLGDIKLSGLVKYTTKLRNAKDYKVRKLRSLYVRRQIEVANGINNSNLSREIQIVKQQIDEIQKKQQIFDQFYQNQYSQFNRYLNNAAKAMSRLEEPTANNFTRYRIKNASRLKNVRKQAKLKKRSRQTGNITSNNVKAVSQ